MNQRMIETALGMLARFIPPEEYAKAVKAINDLAAIAQGFDDRLKRIEQAVNGELVELRARSDFLEAIVRDNVDGAGAAFAERDQWQAPGRIEKALAPAQPGALQHDD